MWGIKMIEIRNLTKRYGKSLALDNISLDFEMNKVYGLLGNNGAGKTSLINIITNRVFASEGTVLIDGLKAEENEQAQGKVFCVTAKAKFPRDMKIKDLFKWEKCFYQSFDIDYAHSLADKFDLDTKKKVSSLSTGYTTILKVVTALASNVEVMILDEPVLGIDSLYREVFYDALLEHQREHKNLMIIATHLIDEVERVLEDVVIISKGKIVKNSTVKDLTANGQSLNQAYVEILKENRHG